MKTFSSSSFSLFLATLACCRINAEEATPPKADALTALGGKVTEKDGGVTGVQFSDCSKLGAAEFKLIGQFKSLKKLVMYGSCNGLNDETLASLSGLSELDDLGIDGMTLSDDGFKHFTAFKNLRSLSLFHPSWNFKSFTGTGLAHLKDLPKLERLTFAGSTAGDAAMESVGQLTQLKDFRTWHTAQTQSGNTHLLKLVNLKELYIGQRLPMGGKPSPASFDDSTLATIAQIKTLERLTLTEAKLTLKGLETLKPLSNLKSLKFLQVDMAEDEVKKLDAAFPGIKVEFKPMSEKEREDLIVKKLKL
jgi:hypothetical protein